MLLGDAYNKRAEEWTTLANSHGIALGKNLLQALMWYSVTIEEFKLLDSATIEKMGRFGPASVSRMVAFQRAVMTSKEITHYMTEAQFDVCVQLTSATFDVSPEVYNVARCILTEGLRVEDSFHRQKSSPWQLEAIIAELRKTHELIFSAYSE